MKLSMMFFLIISLLTSAQAAQTHPTNLATTHNSMHMHGMYGLYPMSRESSGTSWQPQSTPMMNLMFMTDEDWMLMLQGYITGIYDHQGGPRGANKFFSTSMLMFMAQKDMAVGTVGLRAMVSLDPTMGKTGYPLLLQTGETADGKAPLIDRQHPHDAFMELATTYSIPFNNTSSLFFYFGLPGEPALGPPALMMRWSAMYIPESPITHHWMDSTHITYGVITLGYIFENLKLEISKFNGREPDQYRWNIESPRLNSESARITFNPTANWSLQVSYGYLKSPELISPNVNTARITASVMYNLPFASCHNWQTTLAWGQNSNHPGHTLNGYMLESTLALAQTHIFFTRVEHVQKDELFLEPNPFADKIFVVNKFSVGYIYEFPNWKHAKPGLGAHISAYALPHALHSVYGHPLSYMLFGRIDLV